MRIAFVLLGLISSACAYSVSRKTFITSSTIGISTTAFAEELPNGLLETRVTENVNSPVPYGMEASDILYPTWFRGTWKAVSTTKSIVAPCGIALFGGNATYQVALDDIGQQLKYESRFLPAPEGCIADREYNVASIAKAANLRVVNIQTATPNKFSCVLSPPNAPSLLQVDLITVNRRQETLSELKFDASEVVREIVAPVDAKLPSPLKEVETISLYTYDPNTDTVKCQQRSAKFLLPSQSNPMALKMWEAARGRPVDVRFYEIEYRR